jgi:hypothetical protein
MPARHFAISPCFGARASGTKPQPTRLAAVKDIVRRGTLMAANRITRTKTIDGLVTPVFIHNGPSYFFINLQVYADGLVNCWELVDLALFKEKLRIGWVVTSVPDGQEISIHGLGAWKIAKGRWALNLKDLFKRVNDLLRELNPRMENLHDCHGRTTEKIGNVNVMILGSPEDQPVRVSEPGPLAKKIKGDNVSVFVREGESLYLADLRAFADGVIELGRLPSPVTLDLASLKEAIDQGRVVSSPPIGTRVEIYQLGSFAVTEELWSADIADILRSVPDLVDGANERPDSVGRCRLAFEAYLADPTETLRESLRIAYEAVPSRNRMYVGDMDTKDIAVRMILYGDQEIEGWSHRVVARARGEQLPTITVPKPKKD